MSADSASRTAGDGPALAVPRQLGDAQLGGTIRRGVSVIHIVRAGAVEQDGVVPRPDPVPSGFEHEGAAALEHRSAVARHVWSEQLPRAPDANVVGALRALAAGVKGDEQVVVAATPHDERGLDGAAAARGEIDELAALALTADAEPDHFDAAPETAEREPRRP